jgi:hypothetical protein
VHEIALRATADLALQSSSQGRQLYKLHQDILTMHARGQVRSNRERKREREERGEREREREKEGEREKEILIDRERERNLSGDKTIPIVRPGTYLYQLSLDKHVTATMQGIL